MGCGIDRPAHNFSWTGQSMSCIRHKKQGQLNARTSSLDRQIWRWLARLCASTAEFVGDITHPAREFFDDGCDEALRAGLGLGPPLFGRTFADPACRCTVTASRRTLICHVDAVAAVSPSPMARVHTVQLVGAAAPGSEVLAGCHPGDLVRCARVASQAGGTRTDVCGGQVQFYHRSSIHVEMCRRP
jgi:hypothetical protein